MSFTAEGTLDIDLSDFWGWVHRRAMTDEHLNAIMIHPDVFKRLEKVFYKKIKRKLFYDVIWWGAESRYTKCFYSMKKMRKFVNELHLWCDGMIEIEKTWCYREHSPRHKWYYVSYYPNHFVCVEKY